MASDLVASACWAAPRGSRLAGIFCPPASPTDQPVSPAQLNGCSVCVLVLRSVSLVVFRLRLWRASHCASHKGVSVMGGLCRRAGPRGGQDRNETAPWTMTTISFLFRSL